MILKESLLLLPEDHYGKYSDFSETIVAIMIPFETKGSFLVQYSIAEAS